MYICIYIYVLGNNSFFHQFLNSSIFINFSIFQFSCLYSSISIGKNIFISYLSKFLPLVTLFSQLKTLIMLRTIPHPERAILFNLNKISIQHYSTTNPTNNPQNLDIHKIETDLNDYFIYYRTQVAERPFIYRPANKQSLLNMKLRDPITNKLINKTRNFPGEISYRLLSQYMSFYQDDIVKVVRLWKSWLQISKRRNNVWNYFNSNHVADLLLYSYRYELMNKGKDQEVNDQPQKVGLHHVTSFLYSQRNNFKLTGNTKIYDIENFYNVIQMLNIHRHLKNQFKDPLVSKTKIITCWKNVTHRVDTTGLAKVLTDCLIQLQDIDKELILQDMFTYKFMNTTVTLPALVAPNEKKVGQIVADNRNVYLIVKTLILHCSHLLEPSHLAEFQQFVQQYESLQTADTYGFYFNH